MHLVALMALSALLTQTPCETAGLKLPPGFCATVFAEGVTGARHLAIAPNGDVFVATRNARNGPKGGIVALRDTTGDGRADMRVNFGANGGTGIALRGTHLFLATDDAVLRYRLPRGNLLASTKVDTIVRNLPAQGGHTAKSIALGRGNDLFVNIGSLSNSCQVENRTAKSPGQDPCTELDTRAGIWRFNANKKNQAQKDGRRFATGLRNVVAITVGADGMPYGAQHGRDQLGEHWNFSAEANAEKPAEILVRMEAGDDYGWPYCYYDLEMGKHVLAPEYGGDGTEPGRCADIKAPLAAYPGHWGPNGIAFYEAVQFPQKYRGGVFIAFHGSWNRAPLSQAGFNVVFQPMRDGVLAGAFEIFADGFRRTTTEQGRASNRPTGVAVAPDGALFISDDTGGKIWRVTYAGD